MGLLLSARGVGGVIERSFFRSSALIMGGIAQSMINAGSAIATANKVTVTKISTANLLCDICVHFEIGASPGL